MFKNGNFTIATDILWSGIVNFTLLLTSIGQEWQFHITTDLLEAKNGNFCIANDIYLSRMAISHCLLTSSGQQNGNFTLLLLTSSGPEW